MEERNLLRASIGSDGKLSVYPQFSCIEDCVALLKDLCTASTERLLTQCFLHKYESKASDT